MAQRVPAAGARRAAKKTDTTPNPRPGVGPGDNKPPKEDLEEAERVQLISFVSRINAAEGEVEKARGPLQAAQKALSQIYALARGADPTWTRKYLERRMEEMRMGTREMAGEVARENKHRRWLGIVRPDGEQQSLLGAGPQEPRDEFHWRGEGYKAGLRQLSSTPPKECPERFVQAYMQEHEKGLLEVLRANAPKPTPLSPAEQAKVDFKADNPEIDVDKAAKALKNDPKFMDRSAPPEAPAPDESPVANDPDEGFEATEEELSAQIGRGAAREAETADVV